ncbi:cytochrome P450 [Limtongia smithiae]|uniref:cytochrome P450 n=1 Tax=Limtongia smithiae TaxID=1125753 RepID=UPI0034CEE3BB
MASRKFRVALAGAIVYLFHRYLFTAASLAQLGLAWLVLTIAPPLASGLYWSLIQPRFFSPYRHLPQPSSKPHWLFGHTRAIRSEMPGMGQLAWMEEHRDAPWIRYFGFFGVERLLVTSHAAMLSILQTQAYDFVKPELAREQLAQFIGDGLLTAEGDTHKRQRKLLAPAFAYSQIKNLTPTFVDKALELSSFIATLLDAKLASPEDPPAIPAKLVPKIPGAAAGKDDIIVSVDPLLSAATLDAIFKAGFGLDTNSLIEDDHPIVKVYNDVLSMPGRLTLLDNLLIALIVLTNSPIKTAEVRKTLRGRDTIRKFAREQIREKQQKVQIAKTFGKKITDADKDILALMVAEQAEDKNSWTEKEITDNLLTFLAAGHETTSNALIFSLHLLAQHPDVQAHLREEILEHFPEYGILPAGSSHHTDPLRNVTYEKVESLKYLNNVMRECFRFVPPVSLSVRQATRNTVVDGLPVPKGTLIFIVPAAINKFSRYWGDDGSEFNPNRWDHLPTEANNPYSFLTFMQGTRMCIGRKFSEIEYKIMLIALIGRFAFDERTKGEKFAFRVAVTTKYADGLALRIKYAFPQ